MRRLRNFPARRELQYTVHQLCYVTYGSDDPFHGLCKTLDSLHFTANRHRDESGAISLVSSTVTVKVV
ncbi:Hypothetical predicted protein [Scomber scombrus]|uniref:Uncharacterized protein n=1 Tax=Scomber scombrus TaxID=13677 RepID=A0AAV1P8B4_SCOSC